ncbi:hypothetical protein PLICRDRAFT_27427 [Plicaturopsis crispa FD-325 SS-3]|nr:hypothetical protein PLICRDRAFT_27427 [Plicaturopsis crispa FD-325 SS-3]
MKLVRNPVIIIGLHSMYSVYRWPEFVVVFLLCSVLARDNVDVWKLARPVIAVHSDCAHGYGMETRKKVEEIAWGCRRCHQVATALDGMELVVEHIVETRRMQK